MALSNNGSCGSRSIGSYQGQRSAAPASTERAISSPISSPSNGTELVGVMSEELWAEVKCVNARIIAFDHNEILCAQEHFVFLEDDFERRATTKNNENQSMCD